MSEIDDDNKSFLEDLIVKLHEQNKLSIKTYQEDSTFYRVQKTGYAKANKFNQPETLGRYNDPLGEKKVWYGADKPSGALAETFGRLRSNDDLGSRKVFIAKSDIDNKDMCEVNPLRTIKVLDLGANLSKLTLTADQIEGPSYALTNAIVKVVSRLSGSPIDGIAYESRHHKDGGKCFALWIEGDQSPIVSDGKIQNLSKFKYSGELPDGWSYPNIDAEEMLTEVLGFEVTDS